MYIRFKRRYGNAPGSSGTGEGSGTGQQTDNKRGGASDRTDGSQQQQASTLTAEQQAEVQRLVDLAASNVRKQEKEKYEKQIADQKATDEAAKLKEQGEFKTLYETEKAAHEAAKAQAARVVALSETINKGIDTESANWPEEVKALDPGKDNVEARMIWVNSARVIAQKLSGNRQAPTGEHGNNGGGNRPTNGGSGGGNQGESSNNKVAYDNYVGSTYKRPDEKTGS